MDLIWKKHKLQNRAQSVLLVLVLLGLVAVMGQLLLGETGRWLALGLGLAALFTEPAAGGRLTLAAYRAKPLPVGAAAGLWAMSDELARRAGLTVRPQLYLVPSRIANAFAVGSRKAPVIAVTEGLLRTLSPRELAGVLAHEMAHIANNDLRVMGLADTASRLTSLLSMLGLFMLLLALPYALLAPIQINWPALLLLAFAPHLALLAQLGLSRVREFDADLAAAHLTDDPEGLASALVKIEQSSRPWLGWLLPGWGNPEPSWLRTHPATPERIQRLRALQLGKVHRNSWPSTGWQRHHVPLTSPRWRLGGIWR